MAISVNQSEAKGPVVSLDERFDFTCVSDFRNCYESIEVAANKTIVVDFSRTTAIDSSALGMLINCKKHYKEKGVNIAISGCNPQIKKIFDISSFEKLFAFI